MSDNLFSRLKEATRQAQDEQELPDCLAQRALAIADDQVAYAHLSTEIEALIAQLAEYDTFGQTGYIGMGVDSLILGKALERIEAKRRTGGL